LPKVHLHNPVLAYENGDEFMKFFYEAEKGLLDPFVLVVEGSIPNEKIKKEGYWAAMGTNPTPASRLLPASGSIAWRPRPWPSSARARAPPTAASTPWPATRPGAWGWPTTWDGTGVPRPVCPL
jgi:hypothetical protein